MDSPPAPAAPASGLAACQRCGRPTPETSLSEVRIVRKQRIGRGALAPPDEDGLLYRTRTHAYRQIDGRLCPSCAAEAEREADDRHTGLRRATMTLLAGAGLIAAAALAYAVAHPDSGPDLLRQVWRDPNVPRPTPGPAAAAETPYRPPFGNLQ